LLRVAVPTSFALRWLSSRVPDFLVRHPGLRLDLSLNDRYVDLIAERFDCALRIGSDLPDASIYARRLGTIPRVLVAAPRYLKSAPRLATPSDLSEHQALVYSLARTGNDWPFVVDGKPLRVQVSGRLQADNGAMLRDALLAGMGLCLTPHFVVQDLLQTRKLVPLLPDCMPAPLVVWGVTTARRHLPLKTESFLAFVQAELHDSGYVA
jgi:DNA-binding transcriptional LysR family regulator